MKDYFGRAVDIYKDDSQFMVELELLLQEALPKEVRVYLCDLYCKELNETMTMKETSPTLQQRCTLLYLLGNLSAQPVC